MDCDYERGIEIVLVLFILLVIIACSCN
ncbi:sporulation protein YjcZ [Aneurinibacillus sp. Ricciae_BoGa-3]|nr:sporulation protein YjcZ [Aneurinibacillus sp. Ricciae_BoGa-3]WCK56781.1 sporulation protein YjcZ [Aneurinibacillus sp. Ricciae_BoGa-3]